MIAPLVLLLAALHAGAAAGANTPQPGLHVPAPTVLDQDAFGLTLQTIFERQYPLLAAGLARGVPGDLELRLDGLFHHVNWTGFGESRTYDFDEFQGALRWGTYQRLAHDGNVVSSAGYSRFTERIRDGARYFFLKRSYAWMTVTGGASGPLGARLQMMARGLHERETGRDIAALTASLELPAVSVFTPIGDTTVFIRNPGSWTRPWAAGVRSPVGPHSILLYVSNTWGTTAPDSLYGEPHLLLYNLRAAMIF
jgi:hypothetical protein